MKDVRGVCNFLGSVSSQQKFEVTDVKALRQNVSQPSDRPCYSSQLSDRSVLRLHVTPQFYLENERKIHPQGMRACRRKRHGGRERERAPACAWARERLDPGPLASLFVFFFFLPLGLPYVNRASLEFCLLYLRSSLWSSDLPLPNFCRLFPSLSSSHRPPELLFPIITT